MVDSVVVVAAVVLVPDDVAHSGSPADFPEASAAADCIVAVVVGALLLLTDTEHSGGAFVVAVVGDTASAVADGDCQPFGLPRDVD